MDSEDSKIENLSSTHPNSNPSYVLDFINQGEIMGKHPFWDFEFHQLWH